MRHKRRQLVQMIIYLISYVSYYILRSLQLQARVSQESHPSTIYSRIASADHKKRHLYSYKGDGKRYMCRV